ncbi:MAG TPA: SDR family oxidoreductase [Rubrivivax sp.]|jgi:NAD(P)-dependent dehydrogenase (short-subunit alcohol dehydrogenase family)|nr:SDR family oxidoreductase [Rubrivivax sp.]
MARLPGRSPAQLYLRHRLRVLTRSAVALARGRIERGARAEEDMRVMDRPGRPGDIAPVVAFLLSDGSAWIRGTNIAVDGGMHSNVLCQMHGWG